MDTQLTNLGFYFCLFIPHTSKERVQCWLDGEDDYTYFSYDEFLTFVPLKNKATMRKILRDQTFFLWDVLGEKITHISTRYEPSKLGESIKKALVANKEFRSIDEQYFRTVIDFSAESMKV
jgi:hypothetical protein